VGKKERCGNYYKTSTVLSFMEPLKVLPYLKPDSVSHANASHLFSLSHREREREREERGNNAFIHSSIIYIQKYHAANS
jgi:hypothetical protein